MMTSRANRVGAHGETMIFTTATHKGSLQPISMICPKVAGRSLAEGVNLPARCCTLLSSAVKMARSELRGRSIRQARKLLGWPSFIPTSADQNPLAQSRRPMDMIVQGRSMSLFQASQQWSTRSV